MSLNKNQHSERAIFPQPARRRAGADTQLPIAGLYMRGERQREAGLVQDHQLCNHISNRLWSNMFLPAIFRQFNLPLPFCKPGFVLL